MSTLLLADGPIDTAMFTHDRQAYGASLEAVLRPHIGHVLVSRLARQPLHASVIHSLGLGVASVTALDPERPVSEHVERARLDLAEGIFLPDRDLVRFYGDNDISGARGVECRTCGQDLQKP